MNAETSADWRDEIFEVLQTHDIKQVYHVPDAGHSRLIEHCQRSNSIRTVPLTTEEEGIALAAGAWLGGDRCVLLMQSSGVGNCINMISLMRTCRFPLLMFITMRGEWEEFNPWQVPMGTGTAAALAAVGVRALRAETPDEVIETVASAAALAYEADQQIAVLIAQRLIGAKKW